MEYVLIALIAAFVIFIFSREIYRKAKHLPTGECKCCADKGKNMVDEYHKKYCSCCNKKQ